MAGTGRGAFGRYCAGVIVRKLAWHPSIDALVARLASVPAMLVATSAGAPHARAFCRLPADA